MTQPPISGGTSAGGSTPTGAAGAGPYESDFPASGAVGPESVDYLAESDIATRPSSDSASVGTDSGGNSTSQAAKDAANSVKDTAVSQGKQVADTAKEEAANVAGEAKNRASDLFQTARSEVGDQVSTQQQRIASVVHSASKELGAMASKSEESGPITDLAHQAARTGGEIAHWLEDREPRDVLEEVRRFARRRPVAFLALCGLAGVVAGRITRGAVASRTELDSSSTPSSTTSGWSADPTYGLDEPNEGLPR